MNKLKKIPYKFVHVIWIDIVSDSAWRSIDEVKESKCPRCLSTGFLIEDDDVNVDQDKDMDVKVPDGGIMSEEQFDALPPDVGNPPGTALSPSGKTRDDRNEWFAKYGKTHNRSGIKKTYAQYVSDMTPSRRRR